MAHLVGLHHCVQAGAPDEFARLSVDVVATTDAGFSAAKQKNDVETVLAKKPAPLSPLPLDPTISAESFSARPSKPGPSSMFLSNVPTGTSRHRLRVHRHR